MPQVALLNVDGLVINSYTIAEIPVILKVNKVAAHKVINNTKLFWVIVVASDNSSFIKEIGFNSFIIIVFKLLFKSNPDPTAAYSWVFFLPI